MSYLISSQCETISFSQTNYPIRQRKAFKEIISLLEPFTSYLVFLTKA